MTDRGSASGNGGRPFLYRAREADSFKMNCHAVHSKRAIGQENCED